MNNKMIFLVLVLVVNVMNIPVALSAIGAPSLSDEKVTPGYLYKGSGESITFEINYSNTNAAVGPSYLHLTILSVDGINNTTVEMNETDPLDVVYDDGKLYNYTTNEGSSDIFSELGVHKFFYMCEAGGTEIRYPSNVTEYFTFEIIDREPTLSDETVTDPVEAGSDQDITFTINYTHSYNSTPEYIRVIIYNVDGTSPFAAQISNSGNEVNASDQDFTDGKIYRYTVQEGSISQFTEVGVHKFYFTAKDSDSVSSEIRYPENTSEYFTFEIVDYQPTLSDETVSDPILDSTNQDITFTINYTQVNNVAPEYIRLIVYNVAGDDLFAAQISSTDNEVNTSDQDFTDGKIYRYTVQEGANSEFSGIGTHNFYFTAEDDDGVTSEIRYPTSGYFTFEIIPAPTVKIESPNNSTYPTATISVGLSGNAEHYWYYIEDIDSENQTWTTAIDRTLNDGTYTIHAYGNNTQNNITHISVTFTIDTTAPYVNTDSPSNNELYATETISVELSGNAEYYWYYIEDVDSENQTWTTAVDRTLTDGIYTIHAYGNDSAGNEIHVTSVFTIDTIAPSINIDSPDVVTYTTSTISVELSGDADYYWYFIEDVDSENQTWTAAVDRSLNDGTYTIHAYGNDSAGNEAHTVVEFTIDTTGPTVIIDSPIASSYSTNTISVELSGDAEYYWYYIEDVDSENQTWTISTDRTLNDGTYTIHAYGNDSVGNEVQVMVEFTIDTTGPTITIDSPVDSTIYTETISIELSGDADYYWYYIENVDSVNHSWTTTVNRTLSEGTYTLFAFGNDSLGNEAFCSVNFTIVTTTTDPSTGTTDPSTGTTEPSTGTTEPSTISEIPTESTSFPGYFTVLIFLSVVTLSVNRFRKR